MKLSIILPVYNLENYVSKTLDSLLSIRFSHDYEIIVVNDGSTDASEAIIRDYQQKTDKIRLFTTENGGVSNARNVGIRQAAGEYITFLDGDDTVEPDFYEKAVAELDRGGYDFVQGNYREVYEDRMVTCIFAGQDTEILGRKQILERYIDPKNKIIHNMVWGKVYRGDLARQVPFNVERTNANDKEYNFDVICAADRVKLLKDISTDYYQRSGSIVHTMNSRKAFIKLSVNEHILKKNPYPDLAPLTEYIYLETLQELSYYLCLEKDPRAREVRRKMWELPIRQLWPMLDKNTRKRLLLHKFAGPLYDLYFRYRITKTRLKAFIDSRTIS